MELLHQPEEIISERYRIIDTLGQGGSGTTYLAEDLQSGERVALKALSLRRMTDWKMIELFEREARILSQLNHPAIPRYLEYFHVDTPSDRCFYIAQQLAEGKSLATLVQDGWRSSEEEVRRIAIQILEILVYLHKLTPPVIHRDIKPQNIIRREDGKVFLVDFGAVQDTYHNTFMRGSTVVGTYGYMAPEQFRGQAVPTTDLYSLGATLLFLLTHRSPADLPVDGLKIDFRNRVQISQEFADWLEKMLEPDVEDRFPSAKEALEVLHGKRIIGNKVPQTLPWKAIVGLGVAAVVSVSVLNYYQYTLLDFFGITLVTVNEAVRDVDALRRYLEQGGNVNAIFDNYWGNTLLHQAAYDNRKDVVELLIAKGADVNAKNKRGDTPLDWALSSEEVVELLINKGAEVNAKDRRGSTLLHRAADNKWKEVVELLIAKGVDVNAKDTSGSTLLHRAAINNWKEVVELLIAKGADVNAKDTRGSTPLHWANKDVVELLIAKGVNVNVKDNDGNTPLHWATNNSYNSKNVVELLIAKGADVNAKNNNGDTPLHQAQAAINNSKEVVELLIAKGADVNAKNNNGDTPLHQAAKNYFSKDVVELLINKGVNVDAKNNSGDTPLHQAAINNSKEVVELLIAKGADVNAKNNSGNTPLLLAAEKNNKDVVELLKSHGGKD